MKFLRLTTSLNYGGVEKAFELFASNYNGGDEYVFVALGHGGITQKRIAKYGFEVFCLGLNNPSVYNPIATWKLYRWLRKRKFDIIHTAGAEANFHGVLAARLARIPKIVVEEIGLPDHSWLGRLVFKLVYKFADDFVWISKAVQKHLIKLGEVPSGKGTLIYNPVENPLPSCSSKAESGVVFKIASVGRLVPVKNFELLLWLVQEVSAFIEVQLVIVGEGSERAKLEAFIQENELSNMVSLPGYDQIPFGLIADADLFMLPSFTEGFGIALVEAMLLGIPCIGSRVGGIPEIITHEVNGWLMDPYDRKGVLNLVQKVIKLSKEERQRIGNMGKIKAEETFSSQVYIDSLEKLYTKHYHATKT